MSSITQAELEKNVRNINAYFHFKGKMYHFSFVAQSLLQVQVSELDFNGDPIEQEIIDPYNTSTVVFKVYVHDGIRYIRYGVTGTQPVKMPIITFDFPENRVTDMIPKLERAITDLEERASEMDHANTSMTYSAGVRDAKKTIKCMFYEELNR